MISREAMKPPIHRVILESPYRPGARTLAENVSYARFCLRDCINRGEAAIASHLLYTQEYVLDDRVLEERELGIAAGLLWFPVADYIVFYTDRGWSDGMLRALKLTRTRFHYRIRSLVGTPQLPDDFSDDDKIELIQHLEAPR